MVYYRKLNFGVFSTIGSMLKYIQNIDFFSVKIWHTKCERAEIYIELYYF